VSDDVYERGLPGGALNLKSISYPDHGRYEYFPLQGKIPTAESEIEPGTSCLVSEVGTPIGRSYVAPMMRVIIYICIYIRAWVTRRGLEPKVYKLPRPWSLWVSFPTRETSHCRTGNRTRDLMFSRSSDHQATRLVCHPKDKSWSLLVWKLSQITDWCVAVKCWYKTQFLNVSLSVRLPICQPFEMLGTFTPIYTASCTTHEDVYSSEHLVLQYQNSLKKSTKI
jgi:hypothetical protein